ncbi:hypothetical protein TNCV_532451 [Trichonephila clavipes]|nr:hypothetical protein TNCV_532451 [Trichonephila clavipes]
MGQYDDDECTLPISVHCDATEHRCDHHDADKKNPDSSEIMTSHHSCIRFVDDPTIEDSPVCGAASRVVAVMVSELRVHAAANVVELFVQTLVVLQTTPILDSGLVMGLHDALRPCGSHAFLLGC